MNEEQHNEGQTELTFGAAVKAFFVRASHEEFEAGVGQRGRSVYDAMRRLGYRHKNVMGDDQEVLETCINKQRGMGLMLHWFKL